MLKAQRNYGEAANSTLLDGMGISLEEISIGVTAMQKQSVPASFKTYKGPDGLEHKVVSFRNLIGCW
jgi:hypothetical protein